jgi:hypothetical protein
MPVENEHFVAEALRLVEEAEAEGIRLRILGSLAYRIHCPENLALFDAMERALTDIDFAADRRQVKEVRAFIAERGYVEDERMTVSTEGSRYYFEHPETGLGVDVFFDELYFCHRIPLRERLGLDSPTISTCDLLLEKMQIVELNLKDVKDTLVLLLEHPVAGEGAGPEEIDADYVAGLLSDDWGFYHTVTLNLDKVQRFLPDFDAIAPEQGEVITTRIGRLRQRIEAMDKSRKWRMRAKIGPRKKWYQDVAAKETSF